MRTILVLLIILTYVLILPTSVGAAKKFVPKTTVKKNAPVRSGFPAVVRYRGDHLGILLSFANFAGLDSVAYSFTYTTNGIPQGVGGTVTQNNNPTSARELLFGTCSHGVCTYHYNLKDARLSLVAKYTNGKTLTKSYRIKTYQ